MATEPKLPTTAPKSLSTTPSKLHQQLEALKKRQGWNMRTVSCEVPEDVYTEMMTLSRQTGQTLGQVGATLIINWFEQQQAAFNAVRQERDSKKT